MVIVKGNDGRRVIIDGEALDYECHVCGNKFERFIDYGGCCPNAWERNKILKKNPTVCPACGSTDVICHTDLSPLFDRGEWLDGHLIDAGDCMRKRKFRSARKKLFKFLDLLNHDYEEICDDKDPDKYDYDSAFRSAYFGLAYCYCEAEDFSRAYFYISSLGGCGDVCVFCEWINCLVYSRHPQALTTVYKYFNNPDALRGVLGANVPLDSVNEFLKRRMAYLSIEIGHYWMSDVLLEQLKDMPASRDYALKELSYLNKSSFRRKFSRHPVFDRNITGLDEFEWPGLLGKTRSRQWKRRL